LEAQLLEQAAVVGDGEHPLRVVVGAVYLGLGSPPAAMPPVGADHGRVHGASMPPDRRSVAVGDAEGREMMRRFHAVAGALGAAASLAASALAAGMLGAFPSL